MTQHDYIFMKKEDTEKLKQTKDVDERNKILIPVFYLARDFCYYIFLLCFIPVLIPNAFSQLKIKNAYTENVLFDRIVVKFKNQKPVLNKALLWADGFCGHNRLQW